MKTVKNGMQKMHPFGNSSKLKKIHFEGVWLKLWITVCRYLENYLPVRIYLFKVNKGNTRKMCEICSELMIKIPERRHCSSVFIFDIEHVNAAWVAVHGSFCKPRMNSCVLLHKHWLRQVKNTSQHESTHHETFSYSV